MLHLLYSLGPIYTGRLGVKSEIVSVYGRGGVEDTRLEAKAKAKDTKKIRGQGQPF